MERTLQVDWQILLDENQWNSDEEVALPDASAPAAAPSAHSRRAAWIATLLLVLLAGATGLRLWMQAQAGLAAVERGLSHTLTAEHRAATEDDDLLAAALLDPEAEASWRTWMVTRQRPTDRTLDAEIVDFELAGDRALAQVRLTDPAGGVVYRESRFYRETAGGWLRSRPVEELWGDEGTLESEYFLFTFRRLDALAVAEAAPLLDKAYVHMHTVLGQFIPVDADPEEKVAVHVVMRNGSHGLWYTVGEPLAVNSPRLMRLPEEISDGQALAESVAFALRRAAVNRATPQSRSYQPTPEFLAGLRLWLAWEEGTLQADYRNKLVTWLYANPPHGLADPPASYQGFCGLFGVWHIVSPSVPLSFYCEEKPSGLLYRLQPPTGLGRLPLSLNQEWMNLDGSRDPLTGELLAPEVGQPIAMASLLEYITHTFGRESVPVLLDAASEGESWRCAAPERFGVSESELEAGWHAWLAAEYGVDTSAFVAVRHSGVPEIVLDPATARQLLADYQARLP